MRIEELLNSHYEIFSENEKYVCHYLNSHYRDCIRKTIDEFANDCSVSKTLLVRFAKKLGLSGYSELKARLKLEMQENPAKTKGLMNQVTDSYHKMIDDFMNQNLNGLFDRIDRADRVFIYGSGSAQTRVASEMKRIFLPAKEMIHLQGHDMCRALEQVAEPDDLVVIISLSGESDSVVELAKRLRCGHVPTVSITRMKNNTLASVCKENLYIHSIRMPVEYDVEYEIATPYFILVEFLFLSYQNYRAGKRE